MHRCGLVVTPVSVSHAVPTLGRVVDDGEAVVAFPADTGPTEEVWKYLNGLDRLDAVFLEISFPDCLADLAKKSGHHCTETFVEELQKLKRPVRWIVVHRKPRYAEQIAHELVSHNISDVELIQPGKVYDFSA